MKARHIENALALLGAVIVLVGISFAAGDALAEDNANVTSTAIAIHNAAAGARCDAEKASADAAAQAADSVAMDNWVNLDIKLGDRKSVLVARDE